MEIIKTDFNKTGFIEINPSIKRIVAHYENGTKKVFDLLDFLVLRNKKGIIQIDCYKEEELHNDESDGNYD